MSDSFLVPVVSDSSSAASRQVRHDADKRARVAQLVQSQRGEAQDQGGLVRVVIDNLGRVESVVLDPRLSSVSLERLGPHIAAVCAKAFDERLREIGRLVGANSECLEQSTVDVVSAMVEQVDQRS